jgi:hypothetical protein
MTDDTFTVGGTGPVTTADGRTYAPGDTVSDLDELDERNRRLLDARLLVRNTPEPTGRAQQEAEADTEPTKDELLAQAKGLGLTGLSGKTKSEVVDAIREHNAAAEAGGDEA